MTQSEALIRKLMAMEACTANEEADTLSAAADMIAAIADRLADAEREAIEQARLVGMGAERELALRARLAEAEIAVKVVQNASSTLDAGRQEVIRNLQKPIREERNAVATLDSERAANALLTEELDALRAERDALAALLERAGETARAIHVTLAPGDRTFDELMRDAMMADDMARALLADIEAARKARNP